jgi:hypothetical protein
LLAVHTGGSCRKQTDMMLSRVTVRRTSPWYVYLMVLEMVVVVWPSLPDSGSPFSRSCSRLGFAFLPGGGELRRIPVRRFWRFCLLTSTVERPVMRREARRIDCRTSHWRFFANHQSVADPTANTSVQYCSTQTAEQPTATNDHNHSYYDDGYKPTRRQLKSTLR